MAASGAVKADGEVAPGRGTPGPILGGVDTHRAKVVIEPSHVLIYLWRKVLYSRATKCTSTRHPSTKGSHACGDRPIPTKFLSKGGEADHSEGGHDGATTHTGGACRVVWGSI